MPIEGEPVVPTGNLLGNPVVGTELAGTEPLGRQTGRDLRRCSRASPGGRVLSYF
jgi:hypothetical protein